jgi:Sec-independent protein translocase protein TatA
VGLGTEILFMLVLGLLLLGPKRLPTVLGHVARAKTQFENATRAFKSQLQAEVEGQHDNGEADLSHDAAGNQ